MVLNSLFSRSLRTCVFYNNRVATFAGGDSSGTFSLSLLSSPRTSKCSIATNSLYYGGLDCRQLFTLDTFLGQQHQRSVDVC